MIYVSKRQLSQVEYLIEQSLQGNHVLFSTDQIKSILGSNEPPPLLGPSNAPLNTIEESYEVEHHIERLILQKTLEEKRAYLEKLDKHTFELVVRAYFNIIENNLYENQGVRH